MEVGKAASAAPPHVPVAFMDIEMPVMDGLEAARCIRAREAATTLGRPAVSIVGLSGNARPVCANRTPSYCE